MSDEQRYSWHDNRLEVMARVWDPERGEEVETLVAIELDDLVAALQHFPDGPRFFLNKVTAVLRENVQIPNSVRPEQLAQAKALLDAPAMKRSTSVNELLGADVLALEASMLPTKKLPVHWLPVGGV